MFLPGYGADKKSDDKADWQRTKSAFDKMAAITAYRSRPAAEKRAHRAQLKAAQRALADRKRRAAEMQAAGEPAAKIRAMMKGLPYGD